MRLSLSLFFLLFLQTISFAQHDQRIALQTQPLHSVALEVMPVQNNEQLYEAERLQRNPNRPNHFATPLSVNITPETHGTWESTKEGLLVWRMRILSKTAKSLNLGFTQYKMPEGGSMILYSEDQKQVMGPFTPYDNEDHEQLWTPLVRGENLVIEVQLKKDNKADLNLELSYINHDFIGFSEIASGSCNLDVICGAADGWKMVDDNRDIIRSVANISISGILQCTGFLVNNARQDATPYFMTAFHCGLNQNNASSLVAYWKFENSTCRQPSAPSSGQNGDGDNSTFNSGATLKAGWVETDFTLVELDDPVLLTAEAFFSGWNADNTLPSNSICVHHPSNDEKRISFDNDAPYIGTWQGDDANIPTGDHLIIGDWDIGTTEGGSSGAPLFNANKQVIGQLHGGFASCGNDEFDSYGWFHKSWEGDGTPETRLKDWLDPDNTGITSLGGKDALFSIVLSNTEATVCGLETDIFAVNLSPSDNFQGNVTLSLDNIPAGLNATLSATQVAPGVPTTLNISNISALSTGTYEILINGTDGIESAESSFYLNVFAELASVPNLIQPSDQAIDIGPFPILTWQSTPQSENYNFQLATDPDFNTIIETATGYVANSFAINNALEPSNIYYWRVQANNACGISEWTVYSFATVELACLANPSSNIPIEIILSDAAVYESTLEIGDIGTIADLNVKNLTGLHTWIADLDIRLISPAGTEVILFETECFEEDDFNINFDDQALSDEYPCPLTNGNTYRPRGNLSDFNGESAQGTWTLRVEDLASQDGGSLESWTIEICTTTATFAPILADDLAYISPNPTKGEVQLELKRPFQAPFSVKLLSINGQQLENFQYAANTTTIPLQLTSYNNGIYIIKIVSTEGVWSEKVLIQK